MQLSLQNIPEAKNEIAKTLGFARRQRNEPLRASALQVLGDIYLMVDNTDSARVCFEEAFWIARRNSLRNTADNSVKRLFLTELKGDNLDKAQEYLNKYRNVNLPVFEIEDMIGSVTLAFKMGEREKALYTLDITGKVLNNTVDSMQWYAAKAGIAKSMGDIHRQAEYLDSLCRLQERYARHGNGVSLLASQKTYLEHESELRQARLSRHLILEWAIGVTAVLMVLALIYVVRNARARFRASENVVSEQSRIIESHEASLHGKDSEISAKEKELFEKEQRILALDKSLIEKERELSVKEREIGMRDTLILEKEQTIDNQEKNKLIRKRIRARETKETNALEKRLNSALRLLAISDAALLDWLERLMIADNAVAKFKGMGKEQRDVGEVLESYRANVERMLRHLPPETFLKDLENRVNLTYDDLLVKFRRDSGDWNAEYRQIAVMMLCGMPNRVIANILNQQEDATRAKVSRVRDAIRRFAQTAEYGSDLLTALDSGRRR